MPEERDESSSGVNHPEEAKPKQFKPTVITMKTERKKIGPTVIKGSIVSSFEEKKEVVLNKPTIIKSMVETSKSLAEEKKEPLIRPTIIRGSEKVVVQPPKVVQPKIVKPTTIQGGVARKHIEVSTEELAVCCPGVTEVVLSKAKQILGTVMLETIDDKRCFQWGTKAENRYKELVDDFLKLSEDQKAQDAHQHIGRLQVLLGELAESFKEPSGIIARWKKQDPLEKFEELRPEIKQLSSLLNHLISNIAEVKTKTSALAKEFLELFEELNVAVVTTEYLSGLLKNQQLVGILMNRKINLTQVAVYVQQGDMLRSASIQNLETLMSQMQSGLIALSAWMEQVGVFKTHNNTVTKTDNYTFQQGLENVVRQIGG